MATNPAWPTAQGLRVVMQDEFMSGWGKAERRLNVYAVECDTEEQAQQILKSAKKRPEMKRARIVRSGKKRYDPAVYLLTLKHYSELGGSWLE
ncbi:hypothetical protein Mudajogi_00003 [Pseudomonas phage vB_PpuP-Mudajogi]|uniref:Uncharacterized protein n=1 Tax=Pseudomonas phage vB_PpuP-Mudajogi TaxID=3132683 RepID=A0AAX4NBQ3_9CAUD